MREDRNEKKGQRDEMQGAIQITGFMGRRLNVLLQIWRLCQEDGVTEYRRKFMKILGIQC